jgi:uncharacterized protein (TIGR00369 family)
MTDQMPRITPDEFAAIMRDSVPYVGQLGIAVRSIGWGSVSLSMPASDLLLRPGGTVTGPAQMALADIAMYALIMSRLGRVDLAVTTSLTMNFLRRPSPAAIRAEGRLLKLGKRLAVGDVLLYSDGLEEPVAQATVTYSIPPAAAPPVPRFS